jgi:hypothetical protein
MLTLRDFCKVTFWLAVCTFVSMFFAFSAFGQDSAAIAGLAPDSGTLIQQALVALAQAWSVGPWYVALIGSIVIVVNLYKSDTVGSLIPEKFQFHTLPIWGQLVVVAVAAVLSAIAAKVGLGLSIGATIAVGLGSGIAAALAHRTVLQPAGNIVARVASPGITRAVSLIARPSQFEMMKTFGVDCVVTNDGKSGKGISNIKLPLLILAVLISLMLAHKARAETISSFQDEYLQGTGGTKINARACTEAAAFRNTGWINVRLQREVVFDIDFVDADSSATNLTVACETARTNAGAVGSGRYLPVALSTSVAGVTTLTRDTRIIVATTGAGPGTSKWTLSFSRIPAPWINCVFTCGAGGAAADNMTVYARGISP